MNNELKIALFQFHSVWQKPNHNIKKIEHKLHHIDEDTDILLLPEMALTGFSVDGLDDAISMNSAHIRTISKWSSEYNIAIYFSAKIIENGLVYNRGIWCEDGQIKAMYDKAHLFSYGGEDRIYTTGNIRKTVEYKGWNIRLAICYDLRFPVWLRNHNNYDLLLLIAQWPQQRSFAWNQLLIARAIENQSYVAAVNSVGIDGNKISYAGESQVIDYSGKLLHKSNNHESFNYVSVGKMSVVQFREKYPFLNDRDEFTMA